MQHGKDRVLGFDPCCVSYYNNGEYLIVSGSDKKATLMTKEGVKLSEIATQTDWVWSAKARPKQNYVAVACNDGTVGMHQLAFSTVHGLYQVRFCDFVHYCRMSGGYGSRVDVVLPWCRLPRYRIVTRTATP
jgi:intraflagellar transport protein 122